MNFGVDKELYAPFKRKKPLYDALIAYEEHFHFPYPLNFISDDTVEEIHHAIATNIEWGPDTHGGTRIY